MNRLRSLIVLPLAAAAFLAAIARGQLTCHAPQQIQLGATPFATLLSFPSYMVAHPCSSGPTEICRATFLRFTAPQDGWYSAYVIPSLSPSPWAPRIAALQGCGPSAAESFGFPRWTSCDDTGDACGPWRQFASVTFWLQSGQSRTLAVGGNSPDDAGSGQVRIERIGASRFDGAMPLAMGHNSYSLGPLAPTLPFSWECGTGSMPNARRFTFTAPKSGSFRISLCNSNGSGGYQLAASADPSLPSGQTQTAYGGCAGSGGRITIQAQQGITYYIAAGDEPYNFGACLQHQAFVESIDPCPADFNDDDVTDGIDLGILLAAWGTPARDITGDGTTDGVDLGILLAMWGTCPEG